uniref:CBM39 domain-containing protein n=1 Tax=Anopheles dirus TaxID=7168 RepID=A0A182NF16_9DIPT
MKIILFTCMLIVCGTVESSVRTRRSTKCYAFNKQIQIYYPQGLLVTQRANDTLESLELEVYVNQEKHKKRSCDVCANVTTVNSDGNMVIRHPTLLARDGDLFQYKLTKHFRSRTNSTLHCKFTVSKSKLKPAPSTRPLSCPKGSGIEIATLPKTQIDYSDEKALLEATISDLTDSCHSVTNMLVLDSAQNTFDLETQLKNYTIHRLSSLLPTVDWSDMPENVYLGDEKIIFSVKTILTKKKILYMIRGTEMANEITDYDRLERSASANDDDYDSSTDVFDF